MPEPLDLSWIIVAIDRFDNAWILDASIGFVTSALLFEDGAGAEDNHLFVPDGLSPGLYMVENGKIVEGGQVTCYDETSFEPHEISGEWTLIASWPPAIPV
jgi:hypothetical protein